MDLTGKRRKTFSWAQKNFCALDACFASDGKWCRITHGRLVHFWTFSRDSPSFRTPWLVAENYGDRGYRVTAIINQGTVIIIRSLRLSHNFWDKTMVAFKKFPSLFPYFYNSFAMSSWKRGKKKNFPGGEGRPGTVFRGRCLISTIFQVSVVFLKFCLHIL